MKADKKVKVQWMEQGSRRTKILWRNDISALIRRHPHGSNFEYADLNRSNWKKVS